jgi:hypothetical protein
MDAASSYGKLELNPALAGGTHRFDAGSVGIKAGIFGGSVAAEYLVMRRLSAHNPRAAAQAMKIFSLINFGSGAVSGGVAVRNWRIK